MPHRPPAGTGPGFRIQNPDLTDAAQRYVGILGSAPDSLTSEVVPVLQLRDLNEPEWAWLARRYRFYGGQFVNAVAAQFSLSQIQNLPATGRLVIVRRVWLANTGGAAEVFRIQTAVATLGAQVLRVQNFDSRQPGLAAPLNVPAAHIFTSNNAVNQTTANAAHLWLNAAETKVLEGPFVLDPGGSLSIENNTVNLSHAVMFEWEERSLEPTEK